MLEMLPFIDDVATLPSSAVERLEYGKFTDGRGTAEMMEHAILARSRNFPADLLPFCGPRIVGPSLQDNDRLPPWATHGTVMQPVSTGQVSILWSRVKAVPEGRSNRPYQRARFVQGSPQASPWAVFEAIDALLLEEVIRQEEAEVLPLILHPQASAPAEFALTVGPYILAGCPVAIVEQINEGEFFQMVNAVWELLPAPARNGFSAGWGVGASQQGRLSFSAGMTAGPGTARLERTSEGSWKVNESGSGCPVDPAALAAARMFLKLVNLGAGVSREQARERMGRVESLLAPRQQFPSGLLQANSPWVQDQYRSIGRAAYDIWRVEQVIENRNGSPSDTLSAAALMKELWFPESFSVCVQQTVRRLEDPAYVWNAIECLLRWQEEEPAAIRSAIQSSTGEGRQAASRLLSLIERTPKEVLTDLLTGDSTVAWTEIQVAADVQVLKESLKGITEEQLDLHDQLLRLTVLPEPYGTFLLLWVWEFAERADSVGANGTARRIEELRGHVPCSAAVNSLQRLAELESPPDLDEFQQLSPSQRVSLGEAVWRRATELSGEDDKRKDIWLEWALKLLPEGRMVLVDILRVSTRSGMPQLTQSEADALWEAIVACQIPPAAEERLAYIVRKNLCLFLPGIFGKDEAGTWLRRYWPPELAYFLGFSRGYVRSVPEEFRELPDSGLEQVLRFWAKRSSGEAEALEGIGQLLEYCQGRPSRLGGQTPLLWLCGDLSRRSFSFIKTQRAPLHEEVNVEAVAQAATLFCHLSRSERERLLPPSQVGLWDQARSGHALLLVLLLYPLQQFTLSEGQTDQLSGVREALRAHHIDTSQKDTRFRIAAAGFHELSYSKHIYFFPEWKTVLWAAFDGTPFTKQGDLTTALRHYGRTLEEQIDLCDRYLRSTECGEHQRAAETVVHVFIIPLLSPHFERYEVEQYLRLAWHGGDAEAHLQRMNSKQVHLRVDGKLFDLARLARPPQRRSGWGRGA